MGYGRLICLARLLATAARWVRIQTSLIKNYKKWATSAQEWPTQSNPLKKYTKKVFGSSAFIENRRRTFMK